jgi:ABC-2 type transport system permease protein
MYGGMRNVIEVYAPIINRVNPAAVLADAYYAMSVYADQAMMYRSLVILAAFSACLLGLSIVLLRRNRYDSI